MKDALISVIVPIYKVEKYLKQCVDSICNQTYSNLEIILVDDGSPDRCPKICEDYGIKDKRIRVLHKKNGGLSDARNAGTMICKGEYITYVDSDDYIDKDMISVLYNSITKEKADVAIMTFTKTCGLDDCDKALSNGYDVGTGTEILMEMLNGMGWPAWGKLFSRQLVIDERFVKGILYEDFEFIPRIMLKAKKVVVNKQGLYFYRIRQDSIMGKSKKKISNDYIEISHKNLEVINSTEGLQKRQKENLKALIYIQFFRTYCDIYKYQSKYANQIFIKESKKYIRENRKDFMSNKYLGSGYKISLLLIMYSHSLYGFLYQFKK